MKNLCCLLLITFTALSNSYKLSAQNGYSISIEIEGINDSILYIGSYWGEKLTIEDTCSAVHNKTYEFSGPIPLQHGIYFAINQDKNKLFEFCIDEEQFFKLSTDTAGKYLSNMDVNGSKANDLFFSYQNFTAELYTKIQDLYKELEQETDKSLKDSIKTLVADINEKNISYKKDFIEKHPDHILSLIFNILKEPELPDSLSPDAGASKTNAYNYYKNHYWQFVNLNDPRLLRTPVFSKKVNRYFEQVIPKHPDSAIRAADFIMKKTKNNSDVYRYLLFDLTSSFEQSNIMGYDKAFVHMVDTYFTDHSSEWLSPSVYQNITERVDKIRPLLIGNFAPELILMDTIGKFKSLYEVNTRYKVIFFWTFSCGECRKEIKQLLKLEKSTDHDISVFAVNTDTNLSRWKDYIKKNNLDWINVNGTRSISKDYHILYDVYKTPTIYLLDERFRIIAKHLDAGQIKNFIVNYEKQMN